MPQCAVKTYQNVKTSPARDRPPDMIHDNTKDTASYNNLQQATTSLKSCDIVSGFVEKMVKHLLIWVLPTGLKMFRGQTGSTIHLRHGLVWSPPQRLWNFNAWSLKHHLGTMFHDRGNSNAKQRRIFSNNTKPLIPITSLSPSPSMSLDWMQILRCYFILAQTQYSCLVDEVMGKLTASR